MTAATLPDNSIDHVVLATPDVEATSAWVEQVTGVMPSVGGPHLGRGTYNTLCSFGSGSYLEIIGPDPSQPEPSEPRPFQIDALVDHGIASWCVRRSGLDQLASRGAEFDVAFIGPFAMSRNAPEGRLDWKLLFLGAGVDSGLIPFFIEWATALHPSKAASPGLALSSLTAQHPEPQRVLRLLLALDLTLEVCEGPDAGLTVVLEGPAGSLTVPPARIA